MMVKSPAKKGQGKAGYFSLRQKLRHTFNRVQAEEIDLAVAHRDWLVALELCAKFLKKQPGHVPVVLIQAQCYDFLGQKNKAKQIVELAYALDDTFIPAIYQHALKLVENSQIAQALELIALIKDHPLVGESVNNTLSELCMRRAQARLGREYQLRAWMANFENLRYANAYMFRLVYATDDELWAAQEHQFWADTQLPYPALSETAQKEALVRALEFPNPVVPTKQNKIRIGYWGADFKEHSVRYFSRPLLEAHDLNRFDVIIYDDNFNNAKGDKHTEAFRRCTPYFMDTASMDDAAIAALIASHDLDILVEIEGHTSSNRLNLLQHRFAPLQITGLAYPPTTGLKTIDYKMVDVHMQTATSHTFYTERQMVMPESFWCYDPKEDAPYTPNPPHQTKDYITFGCFGNAAKITEAVMQAWAAIFRQAETARLKVVSPSFSDEVTVEAFRERLKEAGMPLTRVSIEAAVGTDKLWYLYQEVDVILDTYPFNGGTTSCWATYAGVPVLTLAGQSLSSCMGKSIMNNLGFPEFVVDGLDTYVQKAIGLVREPGLIDAFREVARERFKTSSLGNGTRYAAQFEALCEQLLAERRQGRSPGVAPAVPPLPLEEMLRRARMVWYQGNIAGCERILKACLRHYGNSAAIVEYEAEILLGQKRFEEFDRVCGELAVATPAVLNLQAQAAIARNDLAGAQTLARQLAAQKESVLEENVALQHKLWSAWLTLQGTASMSTTPTHEPGPMQTVAIWVIGNSAARCLARIEELQQRFLPSAHLTIQYHTCSVLERIERLSEALEDPNDRPDMVVLLREHVEIINPAFLLEIEKALQEADVVSPAGALRWVQKDWAQDLPAYKAWGMLRPSRLADQAWELHFAGTDTQPMVRHAVVLDGQLLAFAPRRTAAHQLDEELGDAALWAEEDWCNRIQAGGGRLLIHRGLGVLVHPSQQAMSMHTTQGQVKLLKRLRFNPLEIPNADYSIQSVQVEGADEAMKLIQLYLSS